MDIHEQNMVHPDALRAFAARGGEGPVRMLNLLQFVDGGAEKYAAYEKAVAPMVAARGGRLVISGNAAELLIGCETSGAWDRVLIVEYPDRAAMLDMIKSPEYAEVAHLRGKSLLRSVLLALDPDSPVAE